MKEIIVKIAAVLTAALIFFLAAAGILYITQIKNNKNQENKDSSLGSLVVDLNSKSDDKQKDPLSGRSVELQGFESMVIKKGQKIVLKNSPDNGDFYVKYCIEDNESKEVLLETDLIPSGNYVEWTVSDNLDIGKYTLAFGQFPYWKDPDTDEYKPLTGGKNVVEIEVVE